MLRRSSRHAARRAAGRGRPPVFPESRRLVDLGRERGVLRADAARNDRGRRLRDAELQFPAAHEQAGAVVLERRGVLSPVRRLRMERAAADCHRRRSPSSRRHSVSGGCSAARPPGCSRRSCLRRRRGCCCWRGASLSTSTSRCGWASCCCSSRSRRRGRIAGGCICA